MRQPTMQRNKKQFGAVAVEFAMVAGVFFMLVLATLELARVEFLLNTLQEVTRRAAAAAANVDYRNADALKDVQADAVFGNPSRKLALGEPVTADHVKIDYLSVTNDTWDLKHMTTLPACPAGNRSNCMTDPNADNCIRFVRARVCASMDDAGNCERLQYQMVFPFFELTGMKLPAAETIVPAGSLGAVQGAIPCT